MLYIMNLIHSVSYALQVMETADNYYLVIELANGPILSHIVSDR